MSSTNQSPEYFAAEKKYLNASSMDEQIFWLEEMIKNFKKHKGSEKMLAELKRRLKKFREKAEKQGKKKGGGKKGIRKEGFQFLIVGKANVGKSSLLKALTNAEPEIADYSFTTKEPELGAFEFQGVKAQVVDMPAFGTEDFDLSLLHTGDCLLIVVEDLKEIKDMEDYLERAKGEKIVVVNKADFLSGEEKRKAVERMKSKKIEGVLISVRTREGVENLKQKMFSKMDVVRIYTKEPGKEASKEPMVLREGSKVRDVAESIRKGFSRQIKEIRLTGPSGKFPNQKIGLEHKVRDRDVVEFHTK